MHELDLMYIHTPSEHRIASQRFEMELQLFLLSKSTSTYLLQYGFATVDSAGSQIAFAVVFALEEQSTPQVHALSDILYRAASLGSSSIRLDFGLLSLEILSQVMALSLLTSPLTLPTDSADRPDCHQRRELLHLRWVQDAQALHRKRSLDRPQESAAHQQARPAGLQRVCQRAL